MTALALSPTELQNLINRGIVSIRPPDTMSVKAMQNKAWRETNRERYRETRRLRYARNRDKIRARENAKYALKKQKQSEGVLA